MDLFDLLTMIGGLCLFLFGMDIMGKALESAAGSNLRNLLGKMTTKRSAGLLTGLGITAVIQSSSATTVMVVGFVNSGLMTLKQAINVIMGANIGTTVTAWVLSLSGIDGSAWYIRLLKPTSFTPILALVGIVFQMFAKSSRKKDIGSVLLGFATLMFGMDTMSEAVKGLANVPAFQELFLLFTNPVLGVIVGAVLTAVIQSSSASVGILQALSATGRVSVGAAIPIIMGQNIGTCITAILSSFGANKNGKRTALVHLSFNVIGTAVLLSLFSAAKYLIFPHFEATANLLSAGANQVNIAVAHSAFNILCTAILLPAAGLLEKLAYILVPETKAPEKDIPLDERLLNTPPVALQQSFSMTCDMGADAVSAMKESMAKIMKYSPSSAETILELEEKTDRFEDILGSYLVKLSTHQIGDAESRDAAQLLKAIGDFERISDHAVAILRSAEELKDKEKALSKNAMDELEEMFRAVGEILDLSYESFINTDAVLARKVEPLESIIDALREKLRNTHIRRLQQGECSIEVGFVWSDLLTNLERVSDHCSNIAGYVLDSELHNVNIHETLRRLRQDDPEFKDLYNQYLEKYPLAAN